MKENDIEQAALKSARNMGAPEEMWIVGVGKIIDKGELTDLGVEYLTTAGKLVCPNPSVWATVTCVICGLLLNKEGHCVVCFPSENS